MKTLFEKILKKCDKVTFEFSEAQIKLINEGYKIYLVVARDHFLSGWGEAEYLNCWHVVICWSALQRDKVLESFKNDKSFKYARDFEDVNTFLNRKFVKTLLVLKDANKCGAWNQRVFVEM